MSRTAKGVVLAAGLGTRLRPLTDFWPKPLVPFAGTTPLELALGRLHAAGIDEVAVNAHHLANQIEAALAANPFDQKLKYSLEAEILGTGGVYNPLRAWQGESEMVVLNGDVVSAIDVTALLKQHRAAGAVATMALLPEVIPGETPIWHRDGQVVAIGGETIPNARQGNFACAHVFSPSFIALLPTSGTFDIIRYGYQAALAQGLKVACLVYEGIWHDLRTPQYYAAAVWDTLSRTVEECEALGLWRARKRRSLDSIFVPAGQRIQQTYEIIGPALLDRSTQVGDGATIGPYVAIEPRCHIGGEATVSHAVLLPDASLRPRSRSDHQVVGAAFTHRV